MEKDFTDWHKLKTRLQTEHSTPTFQQREVWWCSVGLNLGHEMDGKSQYFNRPVLVVRKFNARIFIGVPLTTQIKESPYYHRIQFKGREQCVLLSQFRLWDGLRLTHKMGMLPENEFESVRESLKKLI